MKDRIEPEDINLLRQGLDLSDIRAVKHIEKIDDTVTKMTKVWETIQENLRYPWRQSDRRTSRDEGRR